VDFRNKAFGASFQIWFEANSKSNLNFDESEMLSTRTINLGQYISTKINAWQHECSNHLYRALINLII
jgi:hypothetical protein